MNKTKKLHLNMRNKLMAAVAMLLVSSIMMVSTTYAWFTLSTAPEVQGITTTVGANGNLEIALAPYSGLGTDVQESVVGSSTDPWTTKNLTWGNLLNLEDEYYGLEKITLLPAQFTATPGAEGSANTMSATPLATPVYGVDGRISSLIANTMMGGRTVINDTVTPVTLSDGYTADGGYGVRAVGTSASMSERELAYTNALSEIKSNASLANSSASRSLNQNGAALANIMVAHAQAGDTDNNNYAEYLDELKALIDDLKDSSDYIGESLRATVMAAAMVVSSEEDFSTIKQSIETATLENLFDADGTFSSYLTVLTNQINEWKAIQTKVNNAKTAAAALAGNATITWSDLAGVLTNLMNTSGTIRIKGYTIDEVKSHMNDYNFLLSLAKDCKIELGEGTGVYYDISLMTGKITSTMKAAVKYDGSTVELDASIVTPDVTNPTLTTLYAAAQNLPTEDTFGTGTAMIDVFYGYIVDFMFRTNVSGSKLMLQTEGAQRIYTDSTNEETMGNGSSITFTLSETLTAATARGLLESMNVVFFDPDTSEIFGIAKVNSVENSTDAGTQSITGYLELWSYTVDSTKKYVTLDVTNTKTNDVLCGLDQNTAEEVSVLVFLDGNNVTNADVLNNQNVTATLNLQFASDTPLVPMDNADLKNGSATTPTPTPTP